LVLNFLSPFCVMDINTLLDDYLVMVFYHSLGYSLCLLFLLLCRSFYIMDNLWIGESGYLSHPLLLWWSVSKLLCWIALI
jgi:hypothetical protein